jgi:predicted PurR-regulated permease PerM
MDGPGTGRERSRVGGWPIAAALAVLAIVLYAVRYALLPFVAAAAIAFVIDPLIVRTARLAGCRRWPVAAALYLVILGGLAAAAYPIARTVIPQLSHLIADAPNILRHLVVQAFGQQGVTLFDRHYGPSELVDGVLAALTKLLGVGAAARLAGTGISVVVGIFLTLVLMPYFMISGPQLVRSAIWLIPPERRRAVLEVLPQIVPALRRYLSGIAIVVIYTSLVAWIGFGPLFRLPQPLTLAAVVGVLELVPVVGPLTSATIVALLGVRQQSLWSAALLIAFAIGLRLSIDNLIGPLVLGKAARVHPVVVIMVFVCGAMLFGVVGLLLAVPAAVCLKISLTHYYAEPVADGAGPQTPSSGAPLQDPAAQAERRVDKR